MDRHPITLENLIDWLDGHLEEDLRVQVEEHLQAGCEQCEADLAYLRRVLAVARAEPLMEPPAELAAKAKAIYRPPRTSSRLRWMPQFSGPQPAWVRPVLGMAAALFLVLTVSLYVVGGPTVPVREAMVAPQGTSLEVRQPEDAEWQPIQEEQPLQEGARLRAADDAAVMTLFDGSSLEMGSSAEVTLATLREGLLGSSHSITIQQDAGYVVYHVSKLPNSRSAFRVQAPGALVTVRGTVFAVSVSPEGETQVSVLEGRVRVATDGNRLELAPGEGAAVSTSGTLMPLPGSIATALAPAGGIPSPSAAATDTSTPTDAPIVPVASPSQDPKPSETASAAPTVWPSDTSGPDRGLLATLRPSLTITGTLPIPPRWQTVLPTIIPQLTARPTRPTWPMPTAWPTSSQPTTWPRPTGRPPQILPTILATLWPSPGATVEVTPSAAPPAEQSTPTPAPPGEPGQPTTEATAPPSGWPTPPADWTPIIPTARPILTLLHLRTPSPEAAPAVTPGPPLSMPEGPPWWQGPRW